MAEGARTFRETRAREATYISVSAYLAKEVLKAMSGAIKTIVLLVLALAAIGVIGTLAFTLLGSILALAILGVKIGIFVAIIYLIWCGLRKLVRTV